MPRRRDERPRVLGPYWIESKERFKVITVDPAANGGRGGRAIRYFRVDEEAQANEWREVNEARCAQSDALTVESSLVAYKKHLTEKGNKDISCAETTRRIGLFFPNPKQRLSRVTEDDARDFYEAFAHRTYLVGPKNARREKKVSVDFQRNALSQVKTFLRWCVARGWIGVNPTEKIEGVGRRRKGKKQLTGDEAVRFFDSAIALAGQDDGALGAAMLLVMGPRQGEVRLRKVRDVDLGGTRLLISEAKTKAGDGFVEIPEVLQPLLLGRIEGRAATEPLFPTKVGGHHTKSWLRSAVKRICRRAGVPVVTPHGLRGTFSSVAHRAGVASHVVAAQLGQESTRTTLGNYTDAGAVKAAQQGRALAVIQGGRR